MPPLLSRRSLNMSLAAVLLAAGAARGRAQETPEADVAAGQDRARRLTVQVMIGGEGPFAFAVDTGASRSVVSAELAAALRLPRRGSVRVNGIAGAELVPAVELPGLTVGALRAGRTAMAVMAQGQLGAQGLLGVDLMRNRQVELDFRNGRVVLGRAEPADVKRLSRGRAYPFPPARPGVEEVVVPARQRNGQLMIIDADLNGAPIAAFIDSGAESTVGNLRLRTAAPARGLEPSAATIVVTLQSATGQTISGDLAPLPLLRLGGVGLRGVQVVYADLHPFKLWKLTAEPAVLVGMDVLRHFDSVVLDFARSQVRFRVPAR
ncbi:MAG TPA: retroviral-like aspartic protease family protein [Caulobacteraceae bacterium]|jgi:predicted aspartyl protease